MRPQISASSSDADFGAKLASNATHMAPSLLECSDIILGPIFTLNCSSTHRFNKDQCSTLILLLLDKLGQWRRGEHSQLWLLFCLTIATVLLLHSTIAALLSKFGLASQLE